MLITPGSAEVRQYLHPLGRKSVLDAIAVYLFPAFAVVVSLIALVKP